MSTLSVIIYKTLRQQQIPLDTRNPVMQLRKEKTSYREIDNTVKISRARVQSIIKNFNLPDTTFNKPIFDRPT